MANFVKSGHGRPEPNPENIHGRTVAVRPGQHPLFGMYGDVGLTIVFRPANAAMLTRLPDSEGHSWFQIAFRMSGDITVEARQGGENGPVWSTFELDVAPGAGMVVAERIPPITPRQMVDRFRSLSVPVASVGAGNQVRYGYPGTPFELNNYLCNNPAFGGADEALKLKDLLLNIPWGTGAHAPNLRTLFEISGIDLVNVFTGKGTPEQMEKVLSYVALVIQEKPGVLRGQFPALVRDGIRSMQDMRERGKVLIGLDCNGFVGNWQMAAGYPGVSPGSAIPWWPNRAARRTLAEVHSYDVATFANNQHIVALHRVYVDGAVTRADIAQSTGRNGDTAGPQFSTGHEIRTTSQPGVFSIQPTSGFNPVVFGNPKDVKIWSTGFSAMPT